MFVLPESDHAALDLIRALVAAGAFWLAMLVLRIAWIRHGHPEAQHWLMYLSYSLALLMISGIRFAHWGQPATFDLWLSMLVVVTGIGGILVKNRLSTPPRLTKGERHDRR